jgi:hypothetical protein
MKEDLINDIYHWFVKSKKTIRRLAIIAVIVCPLIIWGLYFIGRFIWGIPTDITADGILGYSAAIISSIATIFLGFITLGLSNRANKTNDNLLDVQKAQLMLETKPFIMFTKWTSYAQDLGDAVINTDQHYICINELPKDEIDISCLSLQITNTTKSFLVAEYLDGYVLVDGIIHQFDYGVINHEIKKILLSPGESRELIFYGRFDFFYKLIGERLTFNFLLENHFGEKYSEQIQAIIISYPDSFEIEIDYTYTSLAVQSYTVEKV